MKWIGIALRILLSAIGLVGVFSSALFWLMPRAASPAVSVTLTSPINGQTVSGVIQLTAEASSTTGRISKVEFYVDGSLVGTDYAVPPAPTGFKVTPQ